MEKNSFRSRTKNFNIFHCRFRTFPHELLITLLITRIAVGEISHRCRSQRIAQLRSREYSVRITSYDISSFPVSGTLCPMKLQGVRKSLPRTIFCDEAFSSYHQLSISKASAQTVMRLSPTFRRFIDENEFVPNFFISLIV